MFNIIISSSDISVFWPGIILLGVIIGFLTGMYGVGGGFLLTPFLKILFGISYPYAVGCSLSLIFINALFASAGHWKKKSVDPLLGSILAVGALIGTEMGIRLLRYLNTQGAVTIRGGAVSLLDFVMSSIFIVLMVTVCITIYLETSGKQQKSEVDTRLSRLQRKIVIPPVFKFKYSGIDRMSFWVPFACSLVIGVLTGLLGIGGGFIYLPLLIYVIGTPTLIAVGTSSFQMVFAGAYGASRYFLVGNVNLILVILLLLGSFVGVKLGINSAHYFGGRKIRKSFILVIAVGVVVILFDLIRDIFG